VSVDNSRRLSGSGASRHRGGRRWGRPALHVTGRTVTVLVSLLFFSPVLMAFVLAFRTTTEIDKNPLALPTSLTLSSIDSAWVQGSLGPAFRNSILVALIAVIWLVASGQVLAYYIVRRGDRRSTIVMLYVLAGLMIPYPARALPLYELMTTLHLTGNLTSVILFQAGSLTPLSTLLYRGFLRRLPYEYEEAALVDGARPSTILFKVVVPLLRPASAAVATLTGVLVWNDFFTPLLLVGGSNQETVPIKIYSFVGEYTTEWGQVFAGLAMAALPIMVVFILLQRYLVVGLGSGLKG
jgi:raffinose/stachyose/melibiose transport system permease protein